MSTQIQYSKADGQATKFFVGQFDESDFSQDTWSGDEVNAKTMNGSIYIKYDDEVEVKEWGNHARDPLGLVTGLSSVLTATWKAGVSLLR